MNIVEARDLSQYGFRPWKNYDLAIKMLKSYKQDEFKSFALFQETPELSTFGESPIFACRFCRVPNYGHLLALANEDGKIGIQDTTAATSKDSCVNQIRRTQGHMNAIFDLAWSDSSLRIVTVSGDHTAMLWDVSATTLSPLGMFEGHSRSVKVTTFRPRDINVFATGARDGMVIIWDYRCAQQNTATIKPDNVISNAHCQSGSTVKRCKRKDLSRADSITGLVFQDENFLISCSAGDGVIKVWDIRRCYSMYKRLPQPCYTLPYPGTSAKNGITSLSVDPGAVRLYANCMDNNIYCYNIATYEKKPVAIYSGHENQTFYIKSCLSSDGQYLLSGSSDDKGYLWNVKRPGPPMACLVGHCAEVTCVDWAENFDDIKVVTCADDSSHRLWRVKPPTDSGQDPDLVGWIEWNDVGMKAHPITHACTPRSIKRMVRQQESTPQSLQRVKREKTEIMEVIEEGQERIVLASVQPRTESKGSRRLFDHDSTPSGSGIEMLSPTSNLPNYVMEGTSPFHRCSSASKQKENWLVKLQTTPSPKQIEKQTPKRRSQLQSTPKACGNLLKFFRVAAKQTPPNVNSCEAQKESPLPKASPSLLLS